MRASARPARLRICHEIWVAQANRGSAGFRRAAERCELERTVHGIRPFSEFGAVQRVGLGGGDREDDRGRGDKGIREARDGVSFERLGDFAAAVLGDADSGGVLRERRAGAGSGQRLARAAPAESEADRNGRVAAGSNAGICEYEVPEVRRSGAARDGYDGHLRGFVVVFLPLLRPAQRQGALRFGEGWLLVSD